MFMASPAVPSTASVIPFPVQHSCPCCASMCAPDALTTCHRCDESWCGRTAVLKELKEQPVRTMVILAGCMGLSRSELIGLKWGDFDWPAKTLAVARGVVHNHVGDTKTQARKKSVPLADELVDALQQWRAETAYKADSDWVFASAFMDGKQPVWPDSLLKRVVRPAVTRAKITKRVGWHTFRHSFSTLLRANGTDIKVQQELLRHANIQTTLNVYTQAVSEQKRDAHERIVGQLLVLDGGK